MDNVWHAIALGIIGGMITLGIIIAILVWRKDHKPW